MTWRKLLFHPLTVLAIALIAAVLFALAVSAYHYANNSARLCALYYHVPIVVPFVMYSLGRAERWSVTSCTQRSIDLVVLILSLIRGIISIPLISGHALFTTYAFLSTRSRTTRVAAMVVLLQVVHLKLFVLQDMTLLGGVGVGSMAALWFGYIHRRKHLH